MSDGNTPKHGMGDSDHETPDSERDALTTNSREFVTTDEIPEGARR